MKHFFDKRIVVLVCLNLGLYAAILLLDIRKAANLPETYDLIRSVLKYAAIVSCLLMCFFAFSHSRRKTAQIQALVFCFTLGADFFLLFTGYFEAGVSVFLGAHICALIRYRRQWLLPACIIAAALFAALALLLPVLSFAEPGAVLKAALCTAYGTLIISVTVSTFHSPQPQNSALFSRLGMLLFIMCDVNVMINNSLQESILYTPSVVLMWAFYLPAQTLLALSATDFPLIEHRGQTADAPL